MIPSLCHWKHGVTAYFGLVEVGGMKAGDTVVISSAAGSVSQIAGQIAKLSGCRVIAITCSEQKLARCRQIGYDDGINCRTEQDLSAAIARGCPTELMSISIIWRDRSTMR